MSVEPIRTYQIDRVPVLVFESNQALGQRAADDLAAIIAQFTGVSEGGGEGTSALPVPLETVHVYGGVFKIIAMCAIASGIVCLFLSPVLKYWMHTELEGKEEEHEQ